MTVSAIIPCYNSAVLVGDAIESVLQQTHSVMEIIAVDDGSTDESLQVLRDYKRQYPAKIKLITGPNAGACHARNLGLASAHGEYLQFLDADDVLRPDKLSHQLALARSAAADLVVGNRLTQTADGSSYPVKAIPTDPWLGLITSRLGVTSSNLWRRTAVAAVGGFTEQLRSSQEYDLMFKLLKNNAKVVYDDAVLTIKRDLTTTSIARNPHGSANNIRDFINLRLKINNYLTETGQLTPALRQAYLQLLFINLRWLYQKDARHSLDLLKQHIPKDYTPMLFYCHPILNRLYGYLYRGAGFQVAEAIVGLYRRIRPAPSNA